MAKTLIRTVYVDGVAYGPASAIPADIAARITNPKAWVDADATAPAPAGVVAGGAQDAAGAGTEVKVPDGESTVKELRDYAKAKDIVLGAAKTKPEILKVLGLADPEEPAQGADGGEAPEDVEESEDDSSEAADGDPVDDE